MDPPYPNSDGILETLQYMQVHIDNGTLTQLLKSLPVGDSGAQAGEAGMGNYSSRNAATLRPEERPQHVATTATAIDCPNSKTTDNPRRRPQRKKDQVQAVRRMLLDCLKTFGVRGASYDRLPWATFNDMLKTYKLEVLNWPDDVTWPGQDGRRDRGIEALSSIEVRRLFEALNHPTAPLSFRRAESGNGA